MGVIPTRMMPMGVWRQSAPPLPYDALVEYVESRTDLWGGGISTGIVPDSETKIEIEFEYLVGPDQQQIYRAGSLAVAFGNKLYVSQGQLQTLYDGTQAKVTDPAVFYGRHHLVCGPFGQVPVLDGTRLGFDNAPRRFVSNNGLALFHDRQNSRLYCCRLWQNGVLLRDFAPCRVGAAGALYDRVSGAVYYPATSTALIPGPDMP